ncbi:MAG: HNH endonuclease [Planctomycetota bacterium]
MEFANTAISPRAVHPLPFQIDHIIAQQHHGETGPDNLALSGLRCNSHKGPNLSGYDWEAKGFPSSLSHLIAAAAETVPFVADTFSY